MRITLNGEPADAPDGQTLADLLGTLHIPPDRVAVEVNLRIVPRIRLAETRLAPGDSVEVVSFVGGG